MMTASTGPEASSDRVMPRSSQLLPARGLHFSYRGPVPPEPALTSTPPGGPAGQVPADRPDLYVRLRGGAGNQLFQYAAARSLAPRDRVRLIPSTTVSQLSITELLPEGLTFVDGPAPTLIDRRLQQFARYQRFARPVVRVLRRIDRRNVYSQRGEFARAFEPRPSRLGSPRLLDGYFQHPSWLDPGARLVVDELLASAPAAFTRLCAGPPFAVVCIRRGDYIRLGHELGEPYYDTCLAQLAPELPIAFAGDDHEFAELLAGRAEASGRTVLRTPPISDDLAVHDFWVTAAASEVVMANSTFCWWATTVGDRRRSAPATRRVWFPARWLEGHGTALRADSWTATL
jgi:hypothetical protein